MMHTGYPDPESRYHNHGPSNPDEARIRYRDAFTDNGYLFYEWVYVVQPQTNELHVMTSIETPLTITIDPTDETPGRKEPFYVPIVVTTVNLDEPEPNWKHLEELAVTIREQREAEYKANPNHPDLVQLRKMVPGAEVPTEAKPRP